MDRLIEVLQYILPAIAGGIVDYLNQKKAWSAGGFSVHVLTATFFGWLAGKTAAGLHYDSDLVAAAVAVGGYFGIRVSFLIREKFLQKG